MKKILLAAVLTAFPLASLAAATPGVDGAKLSEHIRVLASDEFEGRGPATAGEIKTVDYIARQFAASGLQPGGDLKDGKRAWTQDVPLAMFQIDGPVAASAVLGGQKLDLTQGEDVAIRAAMTGQTSVSLKDTPLVFVGYGVKAPERNWDDFKGQSLKGKIMVVLVNDPDFEAQEGGLFGGRAMTYYGRWTYKYEEAARQGAAGVLVVHETAPASYGWNTVKNSNTNTMFDIVRQDPTKSHSQMEGWISREFAVKLFTAAGLDFEAEKKKAQKADFQPVDLKATFSADYKVKAEQIVSKNVVGILPGKTHADEYVLYTGHWDHLGVGRPDAKGDTIYNGAVDNGTGIAGLIEMARVIAAKGAPQRSVVFMAVTAEEKGLLGSEYYAANPLYPLGKTVAVINADALSPVTPTKDFTTSGDAKQDLLDLLIAKGKAKGRVYIPDPTPEAGSFFRSDHFPFAKRGVPAISFGSGIDIIGKDVTYGMEWNDGYTRERYHQPADEWSADWPMTGLVADFDLLVDLGLQLANSRLWPDWGAGAEFKAARDLTKGERK